MLKMAFYAFWHNGFNIGKMTLPDPPLNFLYVLSFYRVSPKKYSITFEQMVIERCLRSQNGGVSGWRIHLDNFQVTSICISCI